MGAVVLEHCDALLVKLGQLHERVGHLFGDDLLLVQIGLCLDDGRVQILLLERKVAQGL